MMQPTIETRLSTTTPLAEGVAKQVVYDPPRGIQPGDNIASGLCREVDPQMPIGGNLFDPALWPC